MAWGKIVTIHFWSDNRALRKIEIDIDIKGIICYSVFMKMNVQKYLEENGLKKLQEEFKIVVTDYPDRVVLNYDQIDSPRFNPICDECRGLILRKDTWEVLSRSFTRFYNVGEDKNTVTFPICESRIEQKIDGSLLSLYWDGSIWCSATRKMAFAEGKTVLGRKFSEVFQEAASKTSLWVFMEEHKDNKNYTWIFELVSPETRVVTPYSEVKINLIGVRHNESGYELKGEWLDSVAKVMHVDRPISYKFTTLEETIEAANKLNSMDEGFVLVKEQEGSFWRMKCKNGKYLAIAHLRGNGQISPKRILKLVMENETSEYLSYFETDKPYFHFVQTQYDLCIERITKIYESAKHIENQKEFALTIIPQCKYQFESGVMFKCRKDKKDIRAVVKEMGNEKMAAGMNLLQSFVKNFAIVVEEDA